MYSKKLFGLSKNSMNKYNMKSLNYKKFNYNSMCKNFSVISNSQPEIKVLYK